MKTTHVISDKTADTRPKVDRTFRIFVISTAALAVVLIVFLLFPVYKLADGTRVNRPVWAPPTARNIDPQLLASLEADERVELETLVQPAALKPTWLAGEKTGIRRRRFPTNPLFWVLIASGVAWFFLQKRLGVF